MYRSKGRKAQAASVPAASQNLIPQPRHSHLGFNPEIELSPTDTMERPRWFFLR